MRYLLGVSLIILLIGVSSAHDDLWIQDRAMNGVVLDLIYNSNTNTYTVDVKSIDTSMYEDGFNMAVADLIVSIGVLDHVFDDNGKAIIYLPSTDGFKRKYISVNKEYSDRIADGRLVPKESLLEGIEYTLSSARHVSVGSYL